MLGAVKISSQPALGQYIQPRRYGCCTDYCGHINGRRILQLEEGNQRWCGRVDSNHHGIATASPSSWCVCQFRHDRTEENSFILAARPETSKPLECVRRFYPEKFAAKNRIITSSEWSEPVVAASRLWRCRRLRCRSRSYWRGLGCRRRGFRVSSRGSIRRLPRTYPLSPPSPDAHTMNITAHHVVACESTVAAPRGPNAVWLPAPPNAPARSAALPLCSSTTMISTRQFITKNAVSSQGAQRNPTMITAKPISSATVHFIQDGISYTSI